MDRKKSKTNKDFDLVKKYDKKDDLNLDYDSFLTEDNDKTEKKEKRIHKPKCR